MDTRARGRTRGGERHSPHGLMMRLGNGPDAAAQARREIAKLRADLDPPLMETMRLLVTELVTNSVRHTDSPSLTLKVAIGSAAVLTEVVDDGPPFDPDCVEESGSDDTGWGLFLVQRLADTWGMNQDGASKRVWFELKRA